MSEWHEVQDLDDIDLSEDGKEVIILFKANDSGNVYVTIPTDMLIEKLRPDIMVEALRG